jgi:hypothetical protein
MAHNQHFHKKATSPSSIPFFAIFVRTACEAFVTPSIPVPVAACGLEMQSGQG